VALHFFLVLFHVSGAAGGGGICCASVVIGVAVQMSISFITGKPGGGKGLMAMSQIEDELVHGKRSIITNLAIRVEPWVNGAGQPMLGLRAYLLKKHGKDFGVKHRVFVLPDEECSSFFLWRAVGVNGETHLEKAEAVTLPLKDGGVKIVEFKTELGLRSGPVMYVIDEAWKFWRARNWQQTGEGLEFYNAQHRKFGDDVLIVTQHTKQVDPAIHRVAQDFWVVKNHSKMSIGAFRQPDVFSVSIYDQAPTGAMIEPMTRKVFRLDKKGLAQTYDTAAGIGLSAGMTADLNARKKGLPWWVLLLAVIGLALLGGQLHKMVGWGASKALFGGGKPAVNKPVNAASPGVAAVQYSAADVAKVIEAYEAKKKAEHVRTMEDEVRVTGLVQVGSRLRVFLSDGADYWLGDGHVTQVTRLYAVIDGRTNYFKNETKAEMARSVRIVRDDRDSLRP
jgi:hypothetical protein